MRALDLPQSAALYTSHVAIVNSLWTVYVAATFTAAGYSTSLKPDAFAVRLAITLGFWAFTVGHLFLLLQGLRVLGAVGHALAAALGAEARKEPAFEASGLPVLAGTANRPWISVAIHLFIDVCVTACVWSPYLASAP